VHPAEVADTPLSSPRAGTPPASPHAMAPASPGSSRGALVVLEAAAATGSGSPRPHAPPEAATDTLCLVCFETVELATPRTAAREHAGLQQPPPGRSAFAPLALPCKHDMCVACADQYLSRAVPRGIRSSRATEVASIIVHCPGLVGKGGEPDEGAFDMRCITHLPTRLLVPFATPQLLLSNSTRTGGLGADAPAPTVPGASALRSAAYILLRCKACPHCGAPSERVEGCRFVECAACLGEWCWTCGDRNPDDCSCVLKYHVRQDLEELLASVHKCLAARSVPAVLFALTLGLPLYCVFTILWAIPYVGFSLAAADAIVAATEAGAAAPQTIIATLPHLVVAAHTAAVQCSCLGRGAAGERSEWRQASSTACRLWGAIVTCAVCFTVVPVITLLWLLATPARYVGAVLGALDTEASGHEQAPADMV
jgi:hypothetical protein